MSVIKQINHSNSTIPNDELPVYFWDKVISSKQSVKYNVEIFGKHQFSTRKIMFSISFDSDVSLKEIEIKYHNKEVQKQDLNSSQFFKNIVSFEFKWINLEDFHILDVFRVNIDCKEVSCQFSFKINEKTRTTFKRKDLFEYESEDDTAIIKFFKNEFQLHWSLYTIEELKLLHDLENYNKLKLRDRMSLKQHFKMLRYALRLERLEECKDYTTLVMSNIQLECVDEECYKFKYNLSVLKGFAENLKELSLELMTMAEYETYQKSGIYSMNLMTFSISDYNSTWITFQCRKCFDVTKMYHIRITPSNIVYRCCTNALFLLKLYGMESYFNTFENLPQGKCNPEKFEAPQKYFNESIQSNPEQMLAVQRILEKRSFPYPYVVFGPPGTGKTTVIIESVVQILERDKNARILITAQSNYACDEIGVRLLKFVSRSKIYRHYSKGFEVKVERIAPELRDVSNMNGNFKGFLSAEQFYHFNVVIVTLMSSATFIETEKRKYFDYIFIDEAGSATEPEVMIPITGFGMTYNKIKSTVVLLGDYKQLGPIVKSQYSEKMGLDVSFMERLLVTDHYKENDSEFKVQLLDNYRSHPEILAVPNKLFYDSKLRSKVSKEDEEFAVGWKLLPNKNVPIIFNSSFDYCCQDGHSFYNKTEANVVRLYVDLLLTQGVNGKEVREEDIGIVTPYRAQLERLQQMFSDKKGVEIGTAEHYQGREKKIIIITTVKSGAGYYVGFLANEKRLNVMLTRAKSLLIMVCNPINLRKNPQWRDFIAFCGHHKVFCTYEYILREVFKIARDKTDEIENVDQAQAIINKSRYFKTSATVTGNCKFLTRDGKAILFGGTTENKASQQQQLKGNENSNSTVAKLPLNATKKPKKKKKKKPKRANSLQTSLQNLSIKDDSTQHVKKLVSN